VLPSVSSRHAPPPAAVVFFSPRSFGVLFWLFDVAMSFLTDLRCCEISYFDILSPSSSTLMCLRAADCFRCHCFNLFSFLLLFSAFSLGVQPAAHVV